MAQISEQCPHCLTERAAFTARIAVPKKPEENVTLVFFQCGVCGQALIVEYVAPQSHVNEWLTARIRGPNWPVHDRYPRAVPQLAPESVPDNVRTAFLDGLHNLERKRPNPAVAMFRRVIEHGVRILDPAAPKGTNLIGRIERLPADVITPAMKNWAHVVRLGGNEALHDPEDFSEKEAEDLRVFTELFLTYAFTLPAMLQARKDKPG